MQTPPISRVPAAVGLAESVCVWNVKGEDPDTLLNATEGVRKEVALSGSDTETSQYTGGSLMGISRRHSPGEKSFA